ncbi:hypothetical protein ACERNI_15610 [Camelimonas sp. ID_303_24]
MTHVRLLARIPLIVALAAGAAITSAQAGQTAPRYGELVSCNAAATSNCKRFVNPINFSNCHQLVVDSCMARRDKPGN